MDSSDDGLLDQHKVQTDKVSGYSKAAQFNRSTLWRIQRSLRDDPLQNILTLIPADYAARLASLTAEEVNAGSEKGRIQPTNNLRRKRPPPAISSTDEEEEKTTVLRGLCRQKTASTVFPLSEMLEQHLRLCCEGLDVTNIDPSEKLAQRLQRCLQKAEQIFQSPAFNVAVFRLDKTLVAKVTGRDAVADEYEALKYLQHSAPHIAAPRPHGMTELGRWGVLFMTYMPSITLEQAWPGLTQEQKQSCQSQLEHFITEMRHVPVPSGAALGAISGSGARDDRMFGTQCKDRLQTVLEFEDWKFSNAKKCGTPVYLGMLRMLLPTDESPVCLTHGDFRPANIMVTVEQQTASVRIEGIIDWAKAGFYPDYHECNKATTLFHAGRTSDWYQYLPRNIAPAAYPIHWLVDRLLGRVILKSD